MELKKVIPLLSLMESQTPSTERNLNAIGLEFQCPYIGRYVVVRTYAAGVHMGVLKDYDAKTQTGILTETRRLWSWEGAFTLSSVAENGITGGKLSETIQEIMVNRIEEIIPTSKRAEAILTTFEPHKI